MNAAVEQVLRDVDADDGMWRGDIDEQAEMDEYYTYLAEMEAERKGQVPPPRPERSKTIPEQLDELRPKEEAFREEVRSHRGRWGSTLKLPKDKRGMRAFADGVLAGIHEWDRRQEREAEEAEKIRASWPSGGTMTGDEDFTPEVL